MRIRLPKNRLESLLAAVRKTGQLVSFYEGVTVDSRKVKPGYIFAAIKGHETDGHLYIPVAVQNGAALILTQEDITLKEMPDDVAVIQVEDVRLAVAKLAFAFESDPQKSFKTAGITGTNGKTTVSTLVHQVLGKLGHKAGLLGTAGRMIGDTLAESRLTTGDPEQIAADMAEMRDNRCSQVVMEVSSHALDQKRTDAIQFDVAAFTNLTHDHLDYHGTPENYMKAKKRLFDELSEDAVAIMNSDETYAAELVKDCKAQIWYYGLGDGTLDVLSNTAEGLILEIDKIRVESPLCGMFNAYNIAAAYLVCRALGCSANNTAAALATAKGARGRLERVEQQEHAAEELPAVFVDYAHTPDALENVLSTLRNMEPKRQLTVVFGCGGDRDRSKRPFMGRIASRYSDAVVITSDNPRTEDPEAIIREIEAGCDRSKVTSVTERPAAVLAAVLQSKPDGIVLIAGKGHETYQEVMGRRHHMDDFELAGESLANRAQKISGEN